MNRFQIDRCQDIDALRAECIKLRQALWDCYALAGADTDGDETPDSLVSPSVPKLAKDAVQALHADYIDAISREGA